MNGAGEYLDLDVSAARLALHFVDHVAAMGAGEVGLKNRGHFSDVLEITLGAVAGRGVVEDVTAVDRAWARARAGLLAVRATVADCD